ncbi:GNAT family N-acetyltransferase [Roseateles sp. DB2]|uniref:GNAT family N-acetyltransferase n=1 Tax=Roseateles sp. DB2 TaxID=3453717 RepID=UPI003EEA9C16
MSPVRIRLAERSDLDRLAPLFNAYRQFYQQPDDLALARSFLDERLRRGESVVLLAEAEGKDGMVLGFCQLYPTFCSVEAQPIFSLYDLFVQPEARRLGVGRSLLRAAEDLALERGVARLDLTTARSNARAQALYESEGWVLDQVFLAYQRYPGTPRPMLQQA